VKSIIGGLIVLGAIGGGGYLVYQRWNADEAKAAESKRQRAEDEKKKKELEDKLRANQADPGTIEVNSQEAGIWLRLGRTPLDTTIQLPASQAHDVVLLHDGNEPTEAQVNSTAWSGTGTTLAAKISVTLKPQKGKKPAELPLQPTTPVLGTTGIAGDGYVHVESTPGDAEVWLFLGGGHGEIGNVWAGRDYELAVVRPGYKTQHVTIAAEDWRDGGDPKIPIDSANKKAKLSRTIELEKAK
jgi:hypothetical protein